jgi:hypothetical protein
LINTALLPADGQKHSFGQLFFIDSAEATNIRAQFNPQIEKELLEIIDEAIRGVSPFAQAYEMMKDQLEADQTNAELNNMPLPEVVLTFTNSKKVDQRTYNLPVSNEVAAVYVPNADGELPESVVTIKRKDTRDLQILSTISGLVDPMVYPIFFPSGDFGWNIHLRKKSDKDIRISHAQFISYRLFTRDKTESGEFNPIHYGKNLFHQYLVDQWVRIEKDRLNYVKFNPKRMLADKYDNVNRAMERRAEDNPDLPLGKKVILPATVQGTPRWEASQYQDAMTMVMRLGKPDLFVTMTTNPKWAEIEANLRPNEKAVHRPELVARVFYAKMQKLKEEIVKYGIFGRAVAFVRVIEFQKRGLPHMHMLVTLAKNDKMLTPADVDKFILAQIPDKDKDPILYDIVANNMMHGPCGPDFPKAQCVQNGRCKKKFPKAFAEETTMNEDGYPYYARPNNGRTVSKNGGTVHLDNRWSIPYCAYLSLLLNCHINVEKCNDIRSTKYLYKYIYKGPDRAHMKLTEKIDHDEVQKYVDGRYVSAPDAAWKIFRYEMQEKSHTIVQLPVHLKGQENFLF